MATSTPKADLLGEIRRAETILFWVERVQILELTFFPASKFAYPKFISYLWMLISTVININYGSCFVERQLIRPFSFEPDFVFYVERVGFLFAMLNTFGIMEKGMSLGLDFLILAQIFLIIRLGFIVARFIMPDKLEITEEKDGEVKVDEFIEKRGNLKFKSIARSVISKFCRYSVIGLWWIVCAIGACICLGYEALVKLWNGLNESEKIGEVKGEEFGAKVCDFESELKLVEEGNDKDEVEYGMEFVREEDNVDEIKVEEWKESDSDEDESSISEGEEVNELKSDRLIHKQENINEVMAEADTKSEEVNEDVSESETDSESEEVEEEDETGSESESGDSKKEEEEEVRLKLCLIAELLEKRKKLQVELAEVINDTETQLLETVEAHPNLLEEIKHLQSPEEEITNKVKAKSEEVNEVKFDAELKSEGENEDEIGSKSELEDSDNSVSGSETGDSDESSSESEEDETESESDSEYSEDEDEWELRIIDKVKLARFLEENKLYQSEEAEFEAHRKLWDEEKQSLSLQIKEYQTSEANHAAERQKWDEEKAALTKTIQKNQHYKTEKEELLNKYYKLIQEKGSVEVELGLQKRLAEECQAGMQAFEEKYTEQREKSLELAGKLSAEHFVVEKMWYEIYDLEAKCRKLEEERFDLMRELAAANYAYEYYRTPHRVSSMDNVD